MSILVGGAIPSTIAGGTVHSCDTNPTGGLSEEQTCPERIGLALLLAFIAGLFQVIMGTLRLGFLVDLVSEPVISGFTSGAAFLIAATQFSNSLGIQKCTKLMNVGTGMLFPNIDHLHTVTLPLSNKMDGFYVKEKCHDGSCEWHHEPAAAPTFDSAIKKESWPT